MFEELRNSMKALQESDDEVRYIVFTDMDGKAIVHTDPAREGRIFDDEVARKARQSEKPIAQLYQRDTGEMLFDIASPVMTNGKHVGCVRIGIPIEVLNQATKQATTSAIILSAVILAVVVAVMVIMLNALFKPIKDLMKVIEAVAQGDFTRQIKVTTNDEIGKLAKAFNQMITAVKELIGGVVNTSKEVLTSSDQLSLNSKEAAQAIQQVASAIEDVTKGNNSQTEQINKIARTINQLVIAKPTSWL